MKILSSFHEYQHALKVIKTEKIAVGYIGADYAQFIDSQKLKCIIVSPTIGSNPYAISELVKRHGWNNVHFLKKLHSKIYLGQGGVVVGSANLSQNALGQNGLFEAGVLFNDRRTVSQLHKLFNIYRSLAKEEYHNSVEKDRALQKLFRDFNLLSERYKGSSHRNKSITFKDYSYDSGSQQFKITWYDEGDMDESLFNKRTIQKELSGESWDDFYEGINYFMPFGTNDSIKEGEWLLTFKVNIKDEDKVLKQGLSWMFIHKFVKKAVKEKGLNNCAFELRNAKKPNSPFKLDDKFKNSFVKVINQPKYRFFHNSKNYNNIKKKSSYRDLWQDIRKEYLKK